MKLAKHQSKYVSYHQDIQAYLDMLMKDGLIESKLHKKLGKSPAQIAREPVFDAYADRALWSLMAKDYMIHNHEDDWDFDRRISEGLVEVGDFTNLRKLWRSYLIEVRAWYWRSIPEGGTDSGNLSVRDKKEWFEIKESCITAFKVYRKFASNFTAQRELTWVEEEIELLEKGEIRKPRLRKALAEKIDEDRFWNIIDSAVSECADSMEMINGHIVDQLQDYKSTEIKRFYNTLLDKLEVLNHWDLWALASLSQGGCSDDSFLYFRSWIISKGREVYDLANEGVHELLSVVPSDDNIWNEGLLYTAHEAYEIRSGGKKLEVKKRKDRSPKGEVWTDENLLMQYPKIAKHYNVK